MRGLWEERLWEWGSKGSECRYVLRLDGEEKEGKCSIV